MTPLRVAFTGGPGAGKTTLIDHLASAGFAHMPEAGRAVIRDQSAIGGPALPSGDRAAFAEAMLTWELRSWHEAIGLRGPVLFDRGLPDLVGYLRLCGLPVPVHVERASQLVRYHARVFVAPPWEAIYETDRERSQDYAEAVATHREVTRAWREFGYETVPLPLASVAERAVFVRSRLGLD